MISKIKTKFGTATICNDGYYHITSRKEGNNGKKLSRLVFEDFYNIKLPSNIQIHHNDGDRTNDNVWNLVPMTASEHTILHSTGRLQSDETKHQISRNKTSTGFFRVIKVVADENMMGYSWQYRITHHNVCFNYASLVDLKERVLAEGLDWFVTDEELAEQSRKCAMEYYEQRKQGNSSGIHNVYKHKDNTCKQGFTWQYQYKDENGRRRIMSNVNLDDLKERVLGKGFKWIVFDDEIAKVGAL